MQMENAGNDTAVPDTKTKESSSRQNRTLDVLTAYIKRQRTLLERISLDISRLNETKQIVDQDPVDALNHILHSDIKTGDEGHLGRIEKLSTLVGEVHGDSDTTITKELDWELFKGHDPTPLHALSPCIRSQSQSSLSSASTHMLPPPTPGAFQCTSLSSLDTLPPESRQNTQLTLSSRGACVREMRRKLVDPALAHAAEFLATFPPDSDDECARPVRAKGAARGARDARVKSARKARVKDMRSNSKRSKATNRKKSDAAAASASVRPRGHGGRFRKLDQIVKDTSAQHAQAAGTSASAVSAFTPTTLTPGPLTLTHQRRFPSDSPSTVGLDEDPLLLEGGRGQRMRRPSTRLGSPTPSVMSAVSSATGSGRGKGKARASPTFPASHWRSSTSVSTSASPAPEGAPRVRLTIRIPPRATLTYSAPEGTGARGYADGHASATTSLGTSVSTSTGMSISTGSGSATATGERRSYSPATTMRSASVVRFVSVKQEDEGDEKFMDVDQNIERDPGALDNCADMGHVLHEAKPEHHAHPGLEEGAYSDSDDSFICEVVPPPSAVTGSSTVTAPGAYRNELSGSNKAMIRNGSTRVNTGADLSSPSRHGKDKSTTFNQTWSDEEQRLLDILLEQFPDGTKNRWSNISKGMDGMRTPRQVASRVQKYFAKMKKWGVDMK